uniref:tRNA pseudouridine synthase n=1 Tax=Alona affinis TaxID=381656 RepID=A0A9N6WW84_9CRUS|nr:EOG090X083V [Alona affinis]
MFEKELIERIQQLNSHVTQLRNLLKEEQVSKRDEKPRRSFDHTKYARRHVFLHVVISIDLRSNLCEGLGIFIPEGHQPKSSSSDLKDEIRYPYLLNKVLPPGIRAVAWAPVHDKLSSRFDCKHRTYHYYFPKADLNIDTMKVASQSLIGEHDFRNLCKMDVGNGVVQFTRRIIDIQIEAIDEDTTSSYAMYRLKLVGQAFLWVRCIVAVLFLVGQGKEEPTIVQELLDVGRNPRKPQYGMASELPLNLFTCSYPEEDCKWIYDTESLRFVISDYQKLWTESNVKATMIGEMLNCLEQLPVESKMENQIKGLLMGAERKTYIPLLKRPTCESLEERIEHFAKRKRIEVVDDTETT